MGELNALSPPPPPLLLPLLSSLLLVLLLWRRLSILLWRCLTADGGVYITTELGIEDGICKLSTVKSA